jgi:Fe-S oxidoreductase
MPELAEAVAKSRSWACYDCGKCTATCPLSRVGGGYSPRRHVVSAQLGNDQDIFENGSLFRCLTCSQCDERCPAEVGYTTLIQQLREIGHQEEIEPQCPHGGALHSVMRMMARGGTQQNRLEWLGDDLKTDPEHGELFFWTGCTMYYDAFFGDFGVSTLDGTRAAIRLMNHCGVEPVVSAEERCCGHDLLWNGDRASFRQLAEHNVRLVAESGAKTLVTSCAECLRTWMLDYREMFEGEPPRILHISQFMEENSDRLNYRANGEKKVTFQDPCRLGRHLGIYDPPRKVLQDLPGVEMVEMRRSGKGATCCAGGTWSHCDRFVKEIQVGRLREARETGAGVMATACPKCQVHFRCAMKDPNLQEELEIEMRDVAELAAAALEPEGGGK